ncbi:MULTISPECIES: general stress protein [unclassified Candidatus Frackibacter]|uniref:general stress protein n=1 Tax=unclassified Candidatus Frackibacter TaxID=2648818 RepID=UPI0008895A49|nr:MULTISPECIES: general stress protein [unclassified Candidatus Frackibacter]SDB98236.1 Heat induced stress protein YflT [Candidatus Frackibacter sp. WG11]SEM29967.1 Heat induced stress protein YflT [Candidatus Frackibacter sp. WG12]SFL34930.1 Heat induced stress protein YflT [Candidatus Frackibacter sp. WG13]
MASIIGVFNEREQAERTVNEIRKSGYEEEEISIIAKQAQEATGELHKDEGDEYGDGGYYGDEYGQSVYNREGNYATEGNQAETGMTFEDQNLTDGTATGGTLGGLAGLVAGAGALAIPGIGPIIAAGPIAAGLSGAVTGGLAGALVDYGIPKEVGQNYEDHIRRGNMLAIFEGAESEEDTAEVAAIMQRNGAVDVELYQE